MTPSVGPVVTGQPGCEMAKMSLQEVTEAVEMTTEEALIFLTDQLEDETARSNAYRSAAIALLDHVAEEAAENSKESRRVRRESEDAVMNMNAPTSTMTH